MELSFGILFCYGKNKLRKSKGNEVFYELTGKKITQVYILWW
jgi:hypothetical protein